MQTFRVDTGWKRWAPMMAALAGGMALIPRQLEAQTQAAPQTPVQSGELEQKSGYYRSIKVGDYTLKIADTQNIWASYTTLVGNESSPNRKSVDFFDPRPA